MPGNKLIIFDLDNTLVITAPAAKEAYKQAIRHIAKQHGIEKQTDKLYAHWKRLVQKLKTSKYPQERQFKYSLATLLSAQKIPDTFLSTGLKMYEKVLLNNLQIQRGVKELFSWLKDNGYQIAVATESLKADAKKKLKSVGIYQDIDHLVTPNDIGVMKPSVEYYQVAIDKSGVSKVHVTVVGDKLAEDIEPAKQLGIAAIQVPPHNFHLGEVQSMLKK